MTNKEVINIMPERPHYQIIHVSFKDDDVIISHLEYETIINAIINVMSAVSWMNIRGLAQLYS